MEKAHYAEEEVMMKSKLMAMDDMMEEEYASSDSDDDSAGDLNSALNESPVISGPPPTDLLMGQNFDGSFPASNQVLSHIGASLAKLDANVAAHADKLGGASDETKVLMATLMVLAALEKNYGAYESSWEMIAEKARAWCLAILQKKAGDRAAARTLLDSLVATL